MDTSTQAVDVPLDKVAHDTTLGQHGAIALDRSKDKMLLELRAVVGDAQALLKEAAGSSIESAIGIPAYLEDRLRAVKDDLQRVKGAMAAKAKDATAATHQYVRENPWRSIGIAAAVGVVISLWLVRASLPALGRIRKHGESL